MVGGLPSKLPPVPFTAQKGLSNLPTAASPPKCCPASRCVSPPHGGAPASQRLPAPAVDAPSSPRRDGRPGCGGRGQKSCLFWVQFLKRGPLRHPAVHTPLTVMSLLGTVLAAPGKEIHRPWFPRAPDLSRTGPRMGQGHVPFPGTRQRLSLGASPTPSPLELYWN